MSTRRFDIHTNGELGRLHGSTTTADAARDPAATVAFGGAGGLAGGAAGFVVGAVIGGIWGFSIGALLAIAVVEARASVGRR